MDDLDRASEREELARAVAARIRKPVPKYYGRCLNCDEPTSGAFCDSGCREDYETYERAAKRNGLRRIEEEE
jgi:hypothetical protein